MQNDIFNFCIDLIMLDHPKCNDYEFLSQRIKQVFDENITPKYISRYLDKLYIESDHLEKESRKIEYYSMHSTDIF